MTDTQIETAATLSPGWRDGRGPLTVLPRLLFQDVRPWLAILVGWLLTIGGSTLIGWAIDRFAGTSPWGLIVFLLMGFGAGVLNVLRSAGVVAEQGDGKSSAEKSDGK